MPDRLPGCPHATHWPSTAPSRGTTWRSSATPRPPAGVPPVGRRPDHAGPRRGAPGARHPGAHRPYPPRRDAGARPRPAHHRGADPAGRAGDALAGAALLPDDTRVGFLGMARDEATLTRARTSTACPPTSTATRCVALDLMIATGGSSVAALGALRGGGRAGSAWPGSSPRPRASPPSRRPNPTCRSRSPRSTSAWTSAASSSPASATPATASTRSRARVSAGAGARLVTGASSGLGWAYAESLAARGHPLAARRPARGAAARAGASGRSAVHGVDRARRRGRPRAPRRASPPAATRSTPRRRPSVAILNAGFGTTRAVQELDREREAAMVRLNCVAVVDLAAHVLPGMVARGAGALVVMSSAAAWQPVPFMATYAATKAFELHLTEALAEELRGTGVRALAVCPGPTRTEFDAVGRDERPRTGRSRSTTSISSCARPGGRWPRGRRRAPTGVARPGQHAGGPAAAARADRARRRAHAPVISATIVEGLRGRTPRIAPGPRRPTRFVTTTLIPIICAVVAALVVLATTPLAARLARAVGAVDVPSDRRIHSAPTPAARRPGDPRRLPGAGPLLLPGGRARRARSSTGAVLIAPLGAVDDIWGLSPGGQARWARPPAPRSPWPRA